MVVNVSADEFGTSLSLRNPRADTRIVGADTLTNPTDYEVAIWVADDSGPLQGSSRITSERENGVHYFGHTEKVKATLWRLESGWALDKRPDDGVDAHRIYTQWNRLWKIVGIGVTYQRLGKDQDWQLMSRTSINYAVELDSTIAIKIAATDERNEHRARQSVEFKITGLSYGGVEVRPVYTAERIATEEKSRSNYRGKVEAVIKIQEG
jgi:hypothetical protein